MENKESFDNMEEKKIIKGIVDNASLRKFVLAGNSRFKIENLKSQNEYTYKIKKSKDRKNMYYVYVESGLGDIYAGYFYENVGYYDYRKGENGNLTEDDIRIKGLLYVLRNAPKLPIHFIVEHFGFCGRCGDILEDTENINAGLCPLCLEMINNKNN